MTKIVLALALFGAALVAAVGASGEPTKAEAKLTEKEVAKLMKDTHVGAKSPHAQTLEQLGKETPDWDQVTKDAKAFIAMGAAFKRTDLGYSSPAKYIESAGALSKAAGAKDKKAASEAFGALTKSCSACHYGVPKGAGK